VGLVSRLPRVIFEVSDMTRATRLVPFCADFVRRVNRPSIRAWRQKPFNPRCVLSVLLTSAIVRDSKMQEFAYSTEQWKCGTPSPSSLLVHFTSARDPSRVVVIDASQPQPQPPPFPRRRRRRTQPRANVEGGNLTSNRGNRPDRTGGITEERSAQDT